MSKDSSKKDKKNSEAALRKALQKAIKNSPIMREAWISAIEAGAAAAIAVIRKVADAELAAIAAVEPQPVKKPKKQKSDGDGANLPTVAVQVKPEAVAT